jgi:hypothetical protein
MMTVSQRETSHVRLMVYAREHRYALRTLRVIELATLPYARNSWSGHKKRATTENVFKGRRGEIVMMTASVKTLNAVKLETARGPVKFALRIARGMVTATHRCVRIFKLQCKRSTREFDLKIGGLSQLTKRNRPTRSISRKMTSLLAKINA